MPSHNCQMIQISTMNCHLQPTMNIHLVGALFSIVTDDSILQHILQGYQEDLFCIKLTKNLESIPRLMFTDGLLYISSHPVIPCYRDICKQLFQPVHDSLGHFGFQKSYASLKDVYYWPNMRRDLEQAYVPSCESCQRNKTHTHTLPGPLHPLPVPDACFDSIVIDFIGPLPPDEGFNSIITMTDWLGADIRIVPSHTTLTAKQFAVIFFDHWYCENGLPADIVSDRNKLFMLKFWKALAKLMGVKLKMSTAYHLETDGVSERSNKTVNQVL